MSDMYYDASDYWGEGLWESTDVKDETLVIDKEQEAINVLEAYEKDAKKLNMTIDEYFEYLKNKQKLNKLRQ